MKFKKLFNVNCKLFLFLNFAIILLLIGCQTTKKELDYKDYLTKKEEARLVEIARAYVFKQMRGKLTKYDIAFIKKENPWVKIDYTDHKYGKAQITWDPSLKVNLFSGAVGKKINLKQLRSGSNKMQKAFYVFLSGDLLDNKLGMQLKIFKKSKVKYYDDRSKIPNTNEMSTPELIKNYAPLIYDTKEEREAAIKVFVAPGKTKKNKKTKIKN